MKKGHEKRFPLKQHILLVMGNSLRRGLPKIECLHYMFLRLFKRVATEKMIPRTRCKIAMRSGRPEVFSWGLYDRGARDGAKWRIKGPLFRLLSCFLQTPGSGPITKKCMATRDESRDWETKNRIRGKPCSELLWREVSNVG